MAPTEKVASDEKNLIPDFFTDEPLPGVFLPSEMTDEELMETMEESTQYATCHQLQTLHSILEHRAGLSYQQQYLSGYQVQVDATVPLSCYIDYSHHIDQMADGHFDPDHPVLSAVLLVCFFYSSGMSMMKPKLIPYFDSALSRAASHIAHQGSAAILRSRRM